MCRAFREPLPFVLILAVDSIANITTNLLTTVGVGVFTCLLTDLPATYTLMVRFVVRNNFAACGDGAVHISGSDRCHYDSFACRSVPSFEQ